MSDEGTINVLIVEPLKEPRMAEIETTLEALEEIVGGPIEEIMPFDEEVVVVKSQEAHHSGLAMNRVIYTEKGEHIESVAGTFFICSAPFSHFGFKSLSDEQIEKYSKLYRYPDHFMPTHTGLIVESGRLNI